jgi:hypothetical protein
LAWFIREPAGSKQAFAHRHFPDGFPCSATG